jgi:hypothetical protein
MFIDNNEPQASTPNARPGVAAYAAPPRSPAAQAAYGSKRNNPVSENPKQTPVSEKDNPRGRRKTISTQRLRVSTFRE